MARSGSLAAAFFLCIIWGGCLPTYAENPSRARAASDLDQVTSVLLQHVDQSKAMWAALKAGHEGTGQISRVLDGLDLARGGYASGEVPASAGIEKVRDFVTNELSVLSALAQKGARSWLDDSGVNSFDPSTLAAAESYLDGWSVRMKALKELIEDVMPLQSAVEAVLDAKAVGEVAATTDTTAALGNGLAASDAIFPRLGGCSTKIDAILSQLEEARAALAANERATAAHSNARVRQTTHPSAPVSTTSPNDISIPTPELPEGCKYGASTGSDALGHEYRPVVCQ
jgi:hypothetical protein